METQEVGRGSRCVPLPVARTASHRSGHLVVPAVCRPRGRAHPKPPRLWLHGSQTALAGGFPWAARTAACPSGGASGGPSNRCVYTCSSLPTEQFSHGVDEVMTEEGPCAQAQGGNRPHPWVGNGSSVPWLLGLQRRPSFGAVWAGRPAPAVPACEYSRRPSMSLR